MLIWSDVNHSNFCECLIDADVDTKKGVDVVRRIYYTSSERGGGGKSTTSHNVWSSNDHKFSDESIFAASTCFSYSLSFRAFFRLFSAPSISKGLNKHYLFPPFYTLPFYKRVSSDNSVEYLLTANFDKLLQYTSWNHLGSKNQNHFTPDFILLFY